jgi:DNA-binding CsgD family transcriptional regulator
MACCSGVRGRGVRVLGACGRELEQEFAFGVVRELFERVLVEASDAARCGLLAGPAALARVAVGIDQASSETGTLLESPFPIVHALYWLVVNLAEAGPLVLVVDDAHWVDAPSLRFLDYLAARLEGLAVGVVVAAHPIGRDAGMLARLRARAGPSVVRLGPLGLEATAAIVRERFGSEPDRRLVVACLEASAGNPFLLGELIDALLLDGVVPDASAAELVAGLGPETVARSLFLRLSRLPGSVGPVADAVAVLDAHAEVRYVAALTGLSLEEVGAAADALAAANVLGEGRPLRFVHPIVRAAVYEEQPAGSRTRLHASAARVLMDEGQPATRVAPHLLLSEPAGDPRVVEVLRRAAAVSVGQGAVDLAQRLLERAWAEPPAAAVRSDVLAELGFAEAAAGRELERASAHLEEASAATVDVVQRAARVEVAARARLYSGDLGGAAERLRRERAALDSAERPIALRLLAQEAAIGLLAPPVASVALAELEQYTGLCGDDPSELAVLAELAGKRWLEGRIGDAVGFAQRALDGGRLVAAEGPASVAFNHAVAVLFDGDRFDAGYPPLEEALALAREQGSLVAISSLTGQQAIAAWREGRLSEVEALSRGVLELLGEADMPVADPAYWAYLGGVLVERGELEQAEDAIARSGCGPGLPKLTYLGIPFVVRARLRLAQARPADALEDLLELRSRERELGVKHMRNPWRREAVQACIALGERDLARELAEEQVELTRRWDIPSALGIARSTLGLATSGAGAIRLLEQGAALLAQSPARLDHARALFDLGSALRRAGRRTDARIPLRDAVDAARGCGANVLASRAYEELVAAGARPRRRQFSGVESLTASEQRVAMMAARGSSNRDIAAALFITVRTVENHLARSYRKLGIGSRAELADALEIDRV